MDTWDELPLNGVERNGVRLRLAREGDFAWVREALLEPSTLAGIGDTAEHAEALLRQLWYEKPEESGLRHFLAEKTQDGERIAYLRLEFPFPEPGCLWLTFFFVAPVWRSQGHGRQIMELLVARAREAAAATAFGLHTGAENEAAIRLYRSAGFACVKREPWEDGRGPRTERLTFRMAC